VINNARFLVLPWIQSKGLASKILSLMARQLPHDWQQRYGFRPVLLKPSWRLHAPRYLLQGRQLDPCRTDHGPRQKVPRPHQQILPVKDIWLYPLRKNFSAVLCD